MQFRQFKIIHIGLLVVLAAMLLSVLINPAGRTVLVWLTTLAYLLGPVVALFAAKDFEAWRPRNTAIVVVLAGLLCVQSVILIASVFPADWTLGIFVLIAVTPFIWLPQYGIWLIS